MNDKKPEKDIGALWAKTSTKGGQYLSGTIEVNGQKISIVCFSNSHKKEAKHPDYKIYVSTPQEQRAETPQEKNRGFDAAIDEALKPEQPKQAADQDDYGLAGVTF